MVRAQNGKRPIGPNPKELWDYKALPIGAVQISEDIDHIKTGTWRLTHPFLEAGTAPSNMNCPVGNDIRSFVHLSSHEDWKESLQVLRRENPFPGVCGRVCYHPCESVCNRGKFDETISIHDLERGVADHLTEADWQTTPIFDKRDEKIAIIGAGPAGLSCAYFALLL
jgi:NADPH-dependent glutamate synthase beta subunit-like oxidoreductase